MFKLPVGDASQAQLWWNGRPILASQPQFLIDADDFRMETRPVVVLTGARQTGKTALVRRMYSDHEYVSLDLSSEAEQAEHDPRRFLQRHPAPLVVDEVQYVPGLLRHVKRAVDAQRATPGQFLLTGSQPFEVMIGVTQSLAGRADVLHLGVLSYAEVLRALNLHSRTTGPLFRRAPHPGRRDRADRQVFHSKQLCREWSGAA